MPWRSGWGAGAAAGILVESAGTWGHEGAPMEEHAAEVLLEHGADPEGFRGRELLDEHVIRADLVLTATRDHRAQVVSMGHSAGLRTFTLKEFTRLVRAIDAATLPDARSGHGVVERANALVQAAAALRGWLLAPSPRRTRSMTLRCADPVLPFRGRRDQQGPRPGGHGPDRCVRPCL